MSPTVLIGIAVAAFVVALLVKLSAASRPETPPAPTRPPSSLAEKESEIEQLVLAGRKLDAIKKVRMYTGMSLRDSKSFVESWHQGRRLAHVISTNPTAGWAASLTPAQEAEVRTLVYSGQKITAVKRVRELTGLGLADAKKIVDRLG